ncbi:MAG: alpha-E domain-containing protein, partial [Limisphaerales bacterium]
MLSRVAHSLYWMARYTERAENIARIVDVNLQLLLDMRNLDEKQLIEYWEPIVMATGDEEGFFKLHPHATGNAVTEFLVFQPENPNSIVQCISSARENARMVRDQITMELWEELNRIYLFVHSPQARKVWARSPSEFFQEIKAASLHVIGIMNATMVHDEGWRFVQAGQFLERADKTTRILDVRYKSLPSVVCPKRSTRRRRSNGPPCCVHAARGTLTKPFTARTCIHDSSPNFFCSTTLFPVRCVFA